MSGIRYRGGWGEAPLSDEAQRMVADLEMRERQEAHSSKLADEVYAAHNGIPSVEQRRATWEENNHRLAVRMAAEEGVSALTVARGEYGHTPSEFVALAGARQDHEDRLRAVQEQKAFKQWQRENAGWEQEPTRAEQIAEDRQRAYMDEWGPKVMERRVERARQGEMRQIAAHASEETMARFLAAAEEGFRG